MRSSITPAIDSVRDVFATSSRLFTVLWSYPETRWKLVVLLAAIVVTGVVDYVVFYIIGRLSGFAESAVPEGIRSDAIGLVAFLIGSMIVLKVIGYTSRTADFVGSRLLGLDQRRIFDHLITTAMARVDVAHLLQKGSREKLERVYLNGREKLVDLLQTQSCVLAYLLEILTGAAVVFVHKWWLLLLPCLAAGQIMRVLLRYSRRSWTVEMDSTGDELRRNRLLDLFLDLEPAIEIRVQQASASLVEVARITNERIVKTLGVPEQELIHSQRGITGLMLFCLLGLGIVLGVEYQSGALTLGTMIFLFLSCHNFFDAVERFSDSWAGQSERAQASKEVLEVGSLKPIEEWNGAIILDKKNGPWPIQFRDVSFSYPDAARGGRRRKWALRKVNLTIEPGRNYVLVGGNGSGKSTIQKLLLGIFRPTEGEILIDGKPITEINLDWWRRIWRIQTQNGIIFPLTVRENIALGDCTRPPTDLEVRAALQSVFSEDLLRELPDGLDTLLTPEVGGLELSGGQKKRIVLARAMFRRDVFYQSFDEPANHLSAGSATALIETILGDRSVTTLLTSHRREDAEKADGIFVFRGGRLAAQGSYAELKDEPRFLEVFEKPKAGSIELPADEEEDQPTIIPFRTAGS